MRLRPGVLIVGPLAILTAAALWAWYNRSNEPDVTAVKRFQAKPDFTYFEACGRPCWQPIYARPEIQKGKAVTDGWPCEYYDEASKDRGPYCADHTSPDGDKLTVVGQTKGQTLRDERLVSSDDWFQVIVPRERVRPEMAASLQLASNGRDYLAYASALWLRPV